MTIVPRPPEVLVADDDPTIRHVLLGALERWGLAGHAFADGLEALERLQSTTRPTLALVDWEMPGLDGPELCRRARVVPDRPALYLILVTGRSHPDDIVTGLDAGADDYVRKPYTIGELLARIKVQFRAEKQGAENEPPAQLVAGEVQIDLPKRKVSVRGTPVDLTPTEYDLLVFMARHHDEVLTHERLLREGWGPEYVDQLDYLRLYIRYLRNKIESNPSQPEIIKTERGIGYYMNTFTTTLN
ncbi:MAG: response regulator transcription factor [Caldilineaceae bacterium]|nr:response regulator transcription factor [Caldilineaceae bacterium]